MSTLTGTVRDAAGNQLLVDGKIWFEISQNANVIAGGGCGGPYAISPGIPNVFTLLDGAIQGSPTIPGQSCISPSNTYYKMSVVTDDGVLVLRRNVVVDGASVDIGALTAPVLPGQTGIPGPQGAPGAQTIRADFVAATNTRSKLHFDNTFYVADDPGGDEVDVTVNLTTTGDGGAVLKQAATPGTQQTGNLNLSGTAVAGKVKAGNAGTAAAPSLLVLNDAKGLFSASTNDLALAANGLEVVRFGPDAGGTSARDAWFQGPVNIGLDPANSFAIRDIGSGLSLQTLRVYTKVLSAPSPTIYQGIGVATNSGEVTADSFFHGITTDIHVDSPLHLGSPSNEIAGAAFFAYQHGHGSVFGVDSATTSQPTATGYPPNFIGVNSQLFNNYKSASANTSFQVGFLTTQNSTGRPGSATAFQSARGVDLDYSTGTVAVTNGSADIVGTSTLWTTIGPSPYVALAQKRIKLPNGVYIISSVTDDTHITLTTTYTGSTLSGQAYKIRIREPWDFGLYLGGLSGSEGIVIEQHADFNNPAGSAFRILNPPGTLNNTVLDMSGNATLVGKVTAGQLEALASAAGNVPLLARGGASPTADIAQFQINSGSATRSRVDKEGSLKTDEAARVAPWIEPEVRASGNTSISSTTTTDLTGATVTFTPKSDCRVQITGIFDVIETVAGGSIFLGSCEINGSRQASLAVFDPAANAALRMTIAQCWNATLTGGTSYTIKLRGEVDAAGSTFQLNATHTKFSIIGVGRF